MRIYYLILCVVMSFLTACGGDSGHHQGGGTGYGPPAWSGGGSGGGNGSENTTDDAIIPYSMTPPVGLTWYVAINNNVPLSTMQTWANKLASTSLDLWNISEEQVYLHRVVFTDNVAPGTNASTYYQSGTYDMMIFTGNTWDLAWGGYVQEYNGRQGHFCAVPESSSWFTNLHEASHMVFWLRWGLGTLLVDEYADGTQDDACVMDLGFSSIRWCGADNHVEQGSQPHSCWDQITNDYSNWTYQGTNVAQRNVPTTTFEYNNTP